MPYNEADKITCLRIYRDNMANISKTVEQFRQETGHETFNRMTFYRWREYDDDFRGRLEEVERELCDAAEHLLKAEALLRSNMTALIFFLKNKHPDYKEKVAVEGHIDNSHYFGDQPTDKLYEELEQVRRIREARREPTGGHGTEDSAGNLPSGSTESGV